MEKRAQFKTTSTVKSKHTPTPWELVDKEDNAEVYIDGPNVNGRGMVICDRNKNGSSNAELIVRAVNSHEYLLEFAKKHHEVCEECEGTGKVYNNADPTSGQWVECPYLTAINEAEEKYDK